MKKNFFRFLPLLVFLFSFWEFHGQIPLYEDYILIKNETAINSSDLEYSPAFYEDGLVFISTKVSEPAFEIKDKKTGTNIMSIFRAKRNSDGLLGAPEVFAGELLSEFHEGPLTFDRTNETIYFTRNNTKKGKLAFRKLKIYSAEMVGGQWENFKELPFNNDEFDACHPAISVENDALYFSSDRPGGQGGMDIWVSRRIGNEWSEPVNLGPTVNSSGNEVFPYLHADGTLYFASNGHGGLGQLDLFYTRPLGDNAWESLVNLGKPFNSEKDDFGLIVDRDNRNGYFSSNRKGGIGGDDIYNFYIDGQGLAKNKKPPKKELQVTLQDEGTGNPLEGATISYINLDNITLGATSAQDGDGSAGILKLIPGEAGSAPTYQLDFEKSEEVTMDANGKIMVPGGNTILKVTKEGYQPKYIPVTEKIFEQGILIGMQEATDCMPFRAMVYQKGNVIGRAGVTVILTNMTTGKQISLISDGTGAVEYCLECNQTFNIIATMGGRITDISTVSTASCIKGQTFNTALYLDDGMGSPLVVGTAIQLPNIYFNFNDAALRPDAAIDLDALVAFLNLYPGMTIELASHTDARGTNRYNQSLSQKRSENVKSFLVDRGIDPSRVIAAGYGETHIQNRCVDGVRCLEQEHQMNRRTEVVIRSLGGLEQQVVETGESNSQENALPSAFGAMDFAGMDFLVIAGTFKNPLNAQQRLDELAKLGYLDAQIIQFDQSGLQAICVAAFDSDQEARSLAKKLKSENRIESYVRKERPEVFK